MMIDNCAQLESLMLEEVCSSKSLEHILKRINECTSLRMAICDLNFKLIYDYLGSTGNELLDHIQKNKCITASMLKSDSELKTKLLMMIQTGKNILFELSGNMTYHVFGAPIHRNAATIGMLFVLMDDETDPKLVECAAKRLCRLYNLFSEPTSDFKGSNSVIEIGLTQELLSSSTDIRHSLYWELYGVIPNRAFSSGYRIAAFSTQNTVADGLPEASESLRHVFPNAASIIKDNMILALLYGLDSNIEAEAEINGCLMDYCQKHDLNCGISLGFDNLFNKNGYIKQAKAVLRFGLDHLGDRVLFSAEKLFGSLILYGASNKFGKDILLPKELKRLIDYDRLNNTDYLETLEQYLNNHNKLSETARMLFLDRSTVKYRLQKINSIIGCDCNEPFAAKRLRYALAIYRM